jgi:hypothetical protein
MPIRMAITAAHVTKKRDVLQVTTECAGKTHGNGSIWDGCTRCNTAGMPNAEVGV